MPSRVVLLWGTPLDPHPPPYHHHLPLSIGLQELWIELSGAAAACYAAAGWQRQAHLMMAGVADVLVQKGQLQMAISLMQNSSRHLLSEGWLHLSAHLQALQLECHQDLGKVQISSHLPNASLH